MGLSAGGLMCESRKASETTDRMRQLKALLETIKEVYRIIRLFTH